MEHRRGFYLAGREGEGFGAGDGEGLVGHLPAMAQIYIPKG